MSRPQRLTVQFHLLVEPAHLEALDRFIAHAPGVRTRSAAVRQLIEAAARSLPAGKA